MCLQCEKKSHICIIKYYQKAYTDFHCGKSRDTLPLPLPDSTLSIDISRNPWRKRGDINLTWSPKWGRRSGDSSGILIDHVASGVWDRGARQAVTIVRHGWLMLLHRAIDQEASIYQIRLVFQHIRLKLGFLKVLTSYNKIVSCQRSDISSEDLSKHCSSFRCNTLSTHSGLCQQHT